jgi:hypothetical protein
MSLLYEDNIELLESENITSGSTTPTMPVFTRMSSYGRYEANYGKHLNIDRLGSTDDLFFSINDDIFYQVEENFQNISDNNIQKVANQIVSLLKTIILPSTSRKLPKFISYIREDGSFLFEWLFPHYRLGFSIELDIYDSCWYFVSDETFGYFSASGNTQTSELRSIIEYLVPFIVITSPNR